MLSKALSRITDRLLPQERSRRQLDDFDPVFYRNCYSDLYHLKSPRALREHYLLHGLREGRWKNLAEATKNLTSRFGQLPEDFNANTYRLLNEDLAQVFDHECQFVLHYLEHGRKEGRRYKVEIFSALDKTTIQYVTQHTSPLPLLVFVHVPKTAGSTVNAVLDRCSPRGLSHCEEIAYTDAFLDRAFDCDWLSGHIYRDAFAGRLTWLNRPVEYFASTREPIAQLLSSINWHFEISHRGTFLAHPVAAQRDIAEVQATDFSQVSAIMALLLKFDSGLLNCQARCILGSDFDSISDSEITRRLNSYCYIATEQTLPDLYQAFGFAEIPRDANELRENAASKYHFDTTLFQTPELRAFLAYHHRHDIALYDLVRRTSWSAQGRRPFRPAFPIVTQENYGEQAYLDANPDVASAVCANEFRSGREHFDASGHAEGRRKLVPPPVPPVLFAIAGDAVRYNDWMPANQGYRCGVFNPVDGVGTPFRRLLRPGW